jgi:hypothetical protein
MPASWDTTKIVGGLTWKPLRRASEKPAQTWGAGLNVNTLRLVSTTRRGSLPAAPPWTRAPDAVSCEGLPGPSTTWSSRLMLELVVHVDRYWLSA